MAAPQVQGVQPPLGGDGDEVPAARASRGRPVGTLFPRTAAARASGYVSKAADAAKYQSAQLAHLSDAVLYASKVGTLFVGYEQLPGDADAQPKLIGGFGNSLAAFADGLPDVFSIDLKLIAGKVEKLREEYSTAEAAYQEGVEEGGQKKKAARVAWKAFNVEHELGIRNLRVSLATSILCRHLLHCIFGVSHEPSISKVRTAVRGAAAGVQDLEARVKAQLPLFLLGVLDVAGGAGQVTVLDLWSRNWGLGTIDTLNLKNAEMLSLLRWVCREVEAGNAFMYSAALAKQWAAARSAKSAAALKVRSSPLHNPDNTKQWMQRWRQRAWAQGALRGQGLQTAGRAAPG